MFQYTHELVLNKLAGSVVDGKIVIERGGEYDPKFIQEGTIWKTAAVEGVLDKITIKVAGLGLEEGKNYAISLFVKLVDPHALFEYGYPNYNSFGKQILIDIKSTGVAADDAALILDSILPQVMENDLTFVRNASSSGSNVILEVGHTGLRFDSMAIATYDPSTCDSCIGEYLDPEALIDCGEFKDSSKVAHTTVGVDPFATGEWLLENLRFPSYPNIRWAAVGEANRPIPGEKYTMYSFAYESPRVGLGGLSGVGQKMEAVTRHIYYVRESIASDFEDLFTDEGCTITTVTSSTPVAATPVSDTARVEKAVIEKEDKA